MASAQVEVAAESQSSVFIDWMAYNARSADGRDMLYSDFPLFYTHTRRGGWKIRSKGQTLGRMPVAVPRQREHFYLRTLLTVKRGARSYRDLYTVNGIVYATPSEACSALGLTFSDSEWFLLFEEIKETATAASLRQTFAVAISNMSIIDAQAVWDQFEESFTDDFNGRFRYLGVRLQPPPDDWTEHKQRVDYGLWRLGENLRQLNLDWGTAQVTGSEYAWLSREENQLIANHTDYTPNVEQREYEIALGRLNSGQRTAHDTVVDTIDNGLRPNTFLIQGAAGTGKTYLYQTLCHKYRAQGKIVLCCASSGIASLLLPNGSTAHSLFKIPVNCTEDANCRIPGQSQLAKLLHKADLIIWDEVTLQNKNDFDAVDRALRLLKQSDEVFGGVPVILGGDFAQILPVVKGSVPCEIVNACLRYWRRWDLIRPLYLTQNMRVIEGENNRLFATWLSDLSYKLELYGKLELPGWIRCTNDRGQFQKFVYPIEQIRSAGNSIFEERAILTARNDSVDRFNNEIAQLVPGAPHDFVACDKVQDEESGHISDYTPEFLITLSGQGLPHGRLSLKIGMPIMLIRNYYPKLGLCNGTRLIITKMFTHCIMATVVSKDPNFNGNEHVISRITVTSNEGLPFTLMRKQLPIRPCFSMTINKSQGQTLQRVGVNLSTPVFSHGQLYLALSRVTDVSNLIVLLPPGGRTTTNVVYPHVLMRAPQTASGGQ